MQQLLDKCGKKSGEIGRKGIYVDGRRVQDQFASEPNQAGGRHCKRGHVDHLEVRHLGKKQW